jgi:hypothetical protein
LPDRVDVVQYLGGDLMHAARLHARLGGLASTFKFSKRAYRTRFDRAFAVDEANAERLCETGLPSERVVVVGNLAIDGALIEAQAPPEPGAPRDGVLFMPGSRGYEVDSMVPFFFGTALRMLREQPSLNIAFGISPFTPLGDVRRAIEGGGHPRMFGHRGILVEEGERAYLATDDGAKRFEILRNALAAAIRTRLVVTTPGTKCIELAVLGVPMVALTPMNACEVITMNGPLTYLDHVPLVGAPLKRAIGVRLSHRFPLHTQPNIDANEMVICELHGTLTPGRTARVALERYADSSWIAWSKERLAALYRNHVGAADRMAESLLDLAG